MGQDLQDPSKGPQKGPPTGPCYLVVDILFQMVSFTWKRFIKVVLQKTGGENSPISQHYEDFMILLRL